jgi:hypothetical protein
MYIICIFNKKASNAGAVADSSVSANTVAVFQNSLKESVGASTFGAIDYVEYRGQGTAPTDDCYCCSAVITGIDMRTLPILRDGGHAVWGLDGAWGPRGLALCGEFA